MCVGSMFFVRIPFAYISFKYLAPFYTRCNLVQRYMCASIGGDELCVCAVRVQGLRAVSVDRRRCYMLHFEKVVEG